MKSGCRPRTALVLVLAAGACAPHPLQQPILSLGERVCDSSPVLRDAVAVPFGDASGVEQRIDADSRCLAIPPAGKASYAVFRLPDAPAPYTVTVASLVTGITLISPRVTLDDAAGTPGRIVEPRDFHSGIDGLEAGLRIRPGERYVVVVANPATLGQPVTLRLSLRERLGVQLAFAGPIFIPLAPLALLPRTPAVTQRPATLSLNGLLRVSAEPIRVMR